MWRVIQAEGRKLSSRWSFKDKLEREFIARWSFKEDCNIILTGSKCCDKEKRCIRARPKMAQAMVVNQPKDPGRGDYNQEKNQGINPRSQVVLLKA